MAKSKDVIYVEMYDAEEVRMVTEHLRKKELRKNDLRRKQAYARQHTLNLIMKAYKRGA